MNEINEKASTLARLTTHWQLFAQSGVPAVFLSAQADILRRVATDLVDLLDGVPGTVRIEFDALSAPYMVDLFAADADIPDTLPEEWL